MTTAAHAVRKRNNPEVGDETLLDDLKKDIEDIRNLYSKRLQQNYASSGQGFGSDPLIIGDLEVCKAIQGN